MQRGFAVRHRLHVVLRPAASADVVAHVGVVVDQQNAIAREVGDGLLWKPFEPHVEYFLQHPVRQPAQCFADKGVGVRCRGHLSSAIDLSLRKVPASEWHANGEGGAASYSTFNCHQTAVQLHQLLHEGKSDPRTFVGASLRASHAMEAIEDERNFVFGNAGSRIADP